MRRARASAAIAVSGLLLSSCAQWLGPARTEADFARKAGTTAKSARSAVEMARVAAEMARKDKAFANYLAVVLSEAEEDATGAQGTFDKIQPPNEKADKQREQLDDLLSEATSVLSELRIAVRRGHLDELARIAEPLAGLSVQLKQLNRTRLDLGLTGVEDWARDTVIGHIPGAGDATE